MSRLRLVALALTLAACSAGASSPKASGPSPHSSDASSRPSATSTPPGGGAPGATAGATPGSGSGAAPTATYADGGQVGDMARAYLRRSPATSLRVEIDWVKGREPAATAIDHLRSVLLGVVDKPSGVVVEKDQEIGSGHDTWTLPEIISLERQYRQYHSQGAVATIWIAYLDGSYADADGTLGLAYSASSDAIFRDRIDDATTAVVLESAIEESVITHEVGHLLGLVNLGYRSATNHEDPQHPHHSSDPNSVMYWQVEDVSIRNLLSGGPPNQFDADDRADLAALRAGG